MKKSRRELDRLTGYGRGKTAQIFSGQTDLKLEHILDFLRVLGVDPKDFFLALFAESDDELPRGPLAEILHSELDRANVRQPGPPAPHAVAASNAPLPAPSTAEVPASADLDRIVAEKLEAALERALGALALKALRQP